MSEDRRTHSVHETRDEAVQAARDLAYLMNGVPFGYVFCIQPKMGKWAFVSMRAIEMVRLLKPPHKDDAP